MPKLKVRFGKRLQRLRLEAGLTQEQLADKIGLTVESVSNMERGLYGPKFENLERIAAVLKIQVRELFDFE